MNKIVGFCGLGCYECGAFLATKENDDRKRATVAQEWSRLFKVEIKPEDINCNGCQSEEGKRARSCNITIPIEDGEVKILYTRR